MQQLRVKMGVRYNILRDMRRDRVLANYESKDRLIDPALYKELKSRKKCDRCRKNFSGRVPEIHHKIPVHPKNGSIPGTNDRNNLMSVCKKCHEILDIENKSAMNGGA